MISENEKYFDEVYSRTNRNVQLFLIANCSNFSDVNDVLQEVYLEFYQVLLRKGKGYFKNEESFLIHLCKKKLFSYYSFWNKISNQISINDKENGQELLDTQDYDMNSLEEKFLVKERVEQVRIILLKKPDDIQKIFYLYYTMEMKLPEIAQLLKMNLQTVKSKLYRTRLAILKELSDDMEVDDEG